MQKVVLTSSVASVFDASLVGSGATLNENHWNPITYEYALHLGQKLSSPETKPEEQQTLLMAIYAASKKVAEEAAWNFVRDEKPSFKLSVVNPSFVIGRPTLQGEGLGGSNGMLWQLLATRPLGEEDGLTGYVDLKDTVEAHIAAMEKDEANGKRFLLVGGRPLKHQLVNWAAAKRPDLGLGPVEAPSDVAERRSKV